jgi:hypothetical protein
MQAPILMRVPRNPGKARLASDRERRDVIMQSNAPSGDSQQDEEIDVSIPKTPAEKLRITVIALGSIILAVILGFVIWYIIIPGVSAYREKSNISAKLSYLLTAMDAQKTDPQISQILTDYEKEFQPTKTPAATTSAYDTATATPAATAAPTAASAATPTAAPTAASAAAPTAAPTATSAPSVTKVPSVTKAPSATKATSATKTAA